MKKWILLAMLTALVVYIMVLVAPWDRGNPAMINTGLRMVQMQIGKSTFTLEVAETPRTREIGLMNRKSVPEDHGMIFVFPYEQWQSFWMKNTFIPLDIIYLDKDGKVVSIHQMKPLDVVNNAESKGKARYAIELNKGAAEQAGVHEGDVLKLPDSVR